jgi:hypothetical protein
MDVIELVQKINRLEAEKQELLEGIKRFTIWPDTYIQCDKAGLHHARCHAEALVRKYETQQQTN